MGAHLKGNAIDVGIVIRDSDSALDFYCGILGLEHERDTHPFGDAVVHHLRCGDSGVKLVRLGREPEASAPPGGITAASGIRFWTMYVSNLEEIVEACTRAHYTVVVPPREPRPGAWMAIVEDPEGNWVELARGGPP